MARTLRRLPNPQRVPPEAAAACPDQAGAVAYGFAMKEAVIPDKLGEAGRRSGTAASSELTPWSRIFALRARPGRQSFWGV